MKYLFIKIILRSKVFKDLCDVFLHLINGLINFYLFFNCVFDNNGDKGGCCYL